MKFDNSTDYLVKPFMSVVNERNYQTKTNVMKILTGITGQGKTFCASQIFIPHLFQEHDIQFCVISTPTTEILDKDDFWRCASKCGVQCTENIADALKMLKLGLKVLLMTTHQAFAVTDKGSALQNYLQTSGIKFAVFIDEAHTWMVSNAKNYQDVMGHKAQEAFYEARMFKQLDSLSSVSPHIYGMTATINREQKGIIEPIGDMKFEVINSIPPLEMMISKSAWLNDCAFYTPYENGNSQRAEIIEMYDNQIIKIFNTTSKKTMMVSAGNKNSRFGFDLNYVLGITRKLLAKNCLAVEDEKVIAVMTANKHETGVYAINGSFEVMTEDEIKDKLNDLSDPLRIVIVVQKGRMGMNIFTLKSLVSFRPQEKMSSDGVFLSEFAIQTLGRLVRLNVGKSLSEHVQKYGYDLKYYIHTISNGQIEKLLEANSFDLMLPDTFMWRVALDKFKTHYVSTTDQARQWIESEKKLDIPIQLI